MLLFIAFRDILILCKQKKETEMWRLSDYSNHERRGNVEARPFLSVIMPVYNAKQYVEQAVLSVLSQTFKDLEIICVNDASSDDSLSVLLNLQNSDSRVKVINSPENVGAGGARNLGLEVATGTYITFIDADDAIEPDLYERATDLAKSSDADEVVWGLIEEHYNVTDKLIRKVPIVPKALIVKDPSELTAVILKLEEDTLFGYQWNSLYRADIIQEHKIRFEKSILYEDYFFNLEFAKYMRSLATMDFAGYHYFKRVNGSITHQFTKDYFDLSYRRVESIYTFCCDRQYDNPQVYTVLANKLLRYTLSALARNHNPLAEMKWKQQKGWVQAKTQQPLYDALLKKARISNPIFLILKFLITHKLFGLMVLMGKLVYWIMG